MNIGNRTYKGRIAKIIVMKAVFIVILSLFSFVTFGQIQNGYVKTKGRLNRSGIVVHGSMVSGAIIQVKGRTPVLSQSDGSFSFPIPSNCYYLESIQKRGYVLMDPEVLSRQYDYSTNPLVLVLETPNQLVEDRLTAERQVRRNLQKQLQQKEDEIEELRQKNQISEENYRELLQILYLKQENNESLISRMVQKYTQMDYDQMDSLDRCISAAIINGHLTEADSLLRSKGNMQERIAEIRMEQHIEAHEEELLSQRQRNLEISKVATLKKLEDAASDCYKFFDRFCLTQQYDSAAFYLDMRSELDTTNISYLLEAIDFEKEFVNDGWEKVRYERALGISQKFYGEQSVEYAMCCNRIGEEISEETYKTANDAETYLETAHNILDSIYGDYHLEMARCYLAYGKMYNSITNGFSSTSEIENDIDHGKEYILRAIRIYKKIAPTRLLDIAKCYMLLYELCCEDYYKEEALNIYKSINKGKNSGIAYFYYKRGWEYYKIDEYVRTPSMLNGYCIENISEYNDHTAIRKELINYKKSIPIFRKAQKKYIELFGEKYPMVSEIDGIIEQIEDEIEKFTQALKFKKPIEALYNIWSR